jgi:hypothetical protein
MFKKKLQPTKKFFDKLSQDEFRRQAVSSMSWFETIFYAKRTSVSN